MAGRVERVLAVVGAAALLVVGFDAVTLAATGSSLILGRPNSANVVTTLTNARACPPGTSAATCAVLNLQTRSTASPPFTTNARGLVPNLYAGRSANADRLGGKSAADVSVSFAAVDKNGQVSHTSGNVSVTHPSAGIYCVAVRGRNAFSRVAVASPDYIDDVTNASAPGVTTQVEVESLPDVCAPASFTVFTFQVQQAPAHVVRYDASFTIVVP